MAAPAAHPAHHNPQSIGVSTLNAVCDMTLRTGISGVLGYLGSRIFMVINPVHGAVFCAVSTLVSKILDLPINYLLNRQGISDSTHVTIKILNLTTCTVLSATLATAIGFPIAFEAALILTVITLLAQVVISSCALGKIAFL